MRKYYAQVTNKYVNDLLCSFCTATQNKSVILCQHWLLHKTSSQSLYLSNRSFNFFDKIADEMRNMFPWEINWLVYSSSDKYNLDIIIKYLNPKSFHQHCLRRFIIVDALQTFIEPFVSNLTSWYFCIATRQYCFRVFP